MKKNAFYPALLAGALLLTGCGTTGSNVLSGLSQLQNANTSTGTSNSTSGSSLLGSLLSGVLNGSAGLSQNSLVGTWKYTGTDCVFESENLLAKAGGALAAKKIESEINTQLAKIGIKEGSCSFTFNKDNTYSATIGGRTLQGNYTLDTENKTLNMTYLAGLGKTNAHVSMTGGKLSILFEGDKLLSLVKGISALSNSSSIKTVSSVLDNYNGLYIGMQMSK